MSNHVQHHHSDDMPRVEPWLVVAALSLVPLAVAIFVPPAMQLALWIAGAALLVIGVAMGAMRRRRRPDASSHDDTARAGRRTEAA